MTSGSAFRAGCAESKAGCADVPGGAGESRQEGRRRQDEQGHAGYAPGDQARARTVIFVRHGRVGPRVEEVLKSGGSARASGTAGRIRRPARPGF